MEFNELVQVRRSHRSYVPGRQVAREQVERLLAQAALAPSSSNQQGWHAVVVATQGEKERMYREACQQKQVLDSSAMILVCGNLEGYKNLPEVVRNTTSMDEKARERVVRGAAESYGSDPVFARDEAIRSATLFAMCFMFAATNAGFGTGPMIGFDSAKMCRAFDIRHPFFPVVLISFGTIKDPPFPRAYRFPVSSFARFV